MPVFYIVFTTVYGLMHWLVYAQASHALALGGPARLALAIWLVLMVFAPAATGVSGERIGPAATLTFVWMGLVFYLFLGSVLALVARPFLGAGGYRLLFLVLTGASVGLCVYGYVNARHIEIRRVDLETDRLPPGVDQVRLAVISDVHLYSVEEGRRLNRVLAALEPVEYDLLISLGDLVEGGIHKADWEPSADRLAALKPRLGKYAVNGNHEAYADRMAGRPISEEFHARAGFTVLSGDVVDAGGVLRVAGLDFPGHFRGGPGQARQLADRLDELPRDRPVVLLNHLPVTDPALEGRFDLQLSGHTHDGQLWPFAAVVRTQFTRLRGLYRSQDGSWCYVNVGTGTWGPPLRVGSTPEITLVRFVRTRAGE